MSELPCLVVALCVDLFFTSRIASIAERLGRRFCAVGDVADLERVLPGATSAVVLVDLAGRAAVADAVAAARAGGARAVVAFGPHRDVAARSLALAAGCDEWLPNSRLVGGLPELLQRFGAERPR